MDWVAKLFNRSGQASKESAKKRLKFVLVHDRASISPAVMDKIKAEMIDVIRKYLDIDDSAGASDISLNEDSRSVALIANIPIKGERRKQAVG